MSELQESGFFLRSKRVWEVFDVRLRLSSDPFEILERFLETPLELASDQTILWIDGVVVTSRQFHLVLGPLDALLPVAALGLSGVGMRLCRLDHRSQAERL
jgi:hypothetical protein